LPRIKAAIFEENGSPTEPLPVAGAIAMPTQDAPDHKLLFKDDRIYVHNILRINYTTYDVRRKRDTVNPNTTHRDIMVLADNNSDTDHPFLYARVIGIFHVNAVYTGGPTVDYRPRKVNVLWLRWFALDPGAGTGSWSDSRLDRLYFPPMAGKDAFSFLDPADVLRSCHIIPAFSTGRRYSDENGISRCARDINDWQSYCLNR
jgi:hypothetical protein